MVCKLKKRVSNTNFTFLKVDATNIKNPIISIYSLNIKNITLKIKSHIQLNYIVRENCWAECKGEVGFGCGVVDFVCVTYGRVYLVWTLCSSGFSIPQPTSFQSSNHISIQNWRTHQDIVTEQKNLLYSIIKSH